MATRIKFNAEPHHLLVADGKEILGGKEGTVDDAVAKQLVENPNVDVDVIAPKEPDMKEKK